MDKNLLQKHIKNFLNHLNNEPGKLKTDQEDRNQRIIYYQSWTKDEILKMSQDDLLEYMSKLYAMLIWGNKQYFVDKLIEDNGFDELKKKLADLIWGKEPIEKRWDRTMKNIKGFGPAMQSELLCYVHPHEHMLWNRRAYVGFSYLGVSDLPKYNYQIT